MLKSARLKSFQNLIYEAMALPQHRHHIFKRNTGLIDILSFLLNKYFCFLVYFYIYSIKELQLLVLTPELNAYTVCTVNIVSNLFFEGRVHCFSMQVVINKCFLLNSEKIFGADPSCRFREKRTFNSEN